jgi:hypothetical protein
MKYNKNLLHLDISSTGLSEAMLWFIGAALRRAKSLISLHLSGNPGVTPALKEYLHKRVRCKELETVNHIRLEKGSGIVPTLEHREMIAQKVREGVKVKKTLKYRRNESMLLD